MNMKLAGTYTYNFELIYKPDLDLLALPFGMPIEADKDGGYFLKTKRGSFSAIKHN